MILIIEGIFVGLNSSILSNLYQQRAKQTLLIIEGIFVGLNSSILSNLYQQRAKQTLKQDIILVKRLAEDNSHERYSKIFADSDLRFTLIDKNGKVEYDSKNVSREEHMDNHLERKEVQEALQGQEGFDIRNTRARGI